MEVQKSYIERVEKERKEGKINLQEGEISQEKFNTNLNFQLNLFDKSKNWGSTKEMMSDLLSHLEKNPYFKPWLDLNPTLKGDIENDVEIKRKILVHKTKEALMSWKPSLENHFDDEKFFQISFLKHHRELAKLMRESGLEDEVLSYLHNDIKDQAAEHDRKHDAFINTRLKKEIDQIDAKSISFDFKSEEEFRKKLREEVLSKIKISDEKNLDQEIEAHNLLEDQEMNGEVKSSLRTLLKNILNNRLENTITRWQPKKEIHFGDIESFKTEFIKQHKELSQLLRSTGLENEIFGQNANLFKAKLDQQEVEHDQFIQEKVKNEMSKVDLEKLAFNFSNKDEFKVLILSQFGDIQVHEKETIKTEIESHGLFEKELKGEFESFYQKGMVVQKNRVSEAFQNWIKSKDIDAHDYDTPEKLMAEFTKDNPKLAKAMGNKDNELEIKKFFGDQLGILKLKHDQEMKEINEGIDDFLARIESGDIDFDPHDLEWTDLMQEYFKTAPESHKKEIMEEHHQKMFFGRFQEAFNRIKEKHDEEMKEINEGVEDFFRKVESGEIDFDPHGKKWEDLMNEYFKLHPDHKKEMMEDHHQEFFFPKFESKFNKLKEQHEQEMKDMKDHVQKWREDVRSGKVKLDIRNATAESLMQEYFKTAPAKYREEMEEDHHKPEFLEVFGRMLEGLRKGSEQMKAQSINDIQNWFAQRPQINTAEVKDPQQLKTLYARDGRFGSFVRDELRAKDFDPLFLNLYRQLQEREQREGKEIETAATNFGKTKEARENKTWEKFEAAFVKMNPKLEAQWKMKPLWQNVLKKEYGKIHKEGAMKLKADEKEVDDKLKQFTSAKEAKGIKTIEQFEAAFLNQDMRLREKLRNNPSLMKKLRDEFGKLQKNQLEGRSKEASEKSSEATESEALTKRYHAMIHEKIVDKTISVDTAVKYREWFEKIDNHGKKEAIEKFDEDMKHRKEVKEQFETSVPKEIRDKHPNFYNLGKSGRAKVMNDIAKEMYGIKNKETAPGSPEAQEIEKMETELIAALSDNVRDKNISLGTYSNFRDWFRESNFAGKKHIMQVLPKEMSDREAVKDDFEKLPKEIQEKNQRFYELGGYPRQLLMKEIKQQMDNKGEQTPLSEKEASLSESLRNSLKSTLDKHLIKKDIAPRAHQAFMEWFDESDMDERKNILAGLEGEMQRREETREMFEKLPKAIQEINDDFYDMRQYPREQKLKEIERDMEAGKYDEAIMMEAGDDEPATTPNRMPLEMDKLKALFPQNFRRFYEFLQFYNTKQFEVFLRKGIINKRPQQFIPRLFENFKFKLRFTTQCHKDPLLKQDFLRGLEKLGIQNPWEPKKKKEELDADIVKNQKIEKVEETKPYEPEAHEEDAKEKDEIIAEVPEEKEEPEVAIEKEIPEEPEEVLEEKEIHEVIDEPEEALEEKETMKAPETVESMEGLQEEQETELKNPEETEKEEPEMIPKETTEEEIEEPKVQDELLKELLRVAREKELKTKEGEEEQEDKEDREFANMIAVIDLLTSRKDRIKKKALVDESKDKKLRLREAKQDAESELMQMIDSLNDPSTPFDATRASKVSEMLLTGKLAFASPRILHSLISRLFAMPPEKNTLKPKLKEILANDQPDQVNVAALFSVFQEIFLTGRETLIEFLRKFAHYACHILERNIETVVTIHPEPGSMIVRDQKAVFELLVKDLMDIRDKDAISKFAFSAENPRKYLEIMNIRMVFGIHVGPKIALSFHETTLVTEEYLKGIAAQQRKVV